MTTFCCTKNIDRSYKYKILANPLPQKSGHRSDCPEIKEENILDSFSFLSVCLSLLRLSPRKGKRRDWNVCKFRSPSFPPKYTTGKEKNFPDEWKRGGGRRDLSSISAIFCFLFFSGFWDVWWGRKKWCLRRCLVFSSAFLFHRSGKEIALCGENKEVCAWEKRVPHVWPSHYTAATSPCIQIQCFC